MGLLVRLGLVVAGPFLRWVSRHPLRTAGAVAGLLAAWVVLASLGTFDPATMTLSGVTPRRLVRFSLARPAYPVAVVVGLGAFLFPR